MITEQDLQEAIAECQGVRNPNANTAIKLAAFLTIQKELYGSAEPPTYSFAAAPEYPENNINVKSGDSPAVGDYGDSDFLQAVKGKDPAAMWAIVDDLMDTLKMVNERVYNGVMRKIK